MTDYSPNEFIAFYFRDPTTAQQRLDRSVALVEAHTPYRICDVWLSPRQSVGLLNLCTKPPAKVLSGWSRMKSEWLGAQPHFNRLRLRSQMAWLRTGYITTPERAFEGSLREDGQQLRSRDAGGIAAFCLVHWGGEGDERLFLWSTRPGLRAIASGEGPSGLVAGTRPRLVHALTRDFRAPSLDLGYIRAALNGWSLDDLTPYEGTTLLSVDRTLRVCGDRRSVEQHPTPPFRREERIFRKQWPLYRDALCEAVEPLRALRGFELRLSGGKDSRLLAAALWNRGITPTTLACQGPEDSPEVRVARRVAEVLGWTLQRAQPSFAYRGGLVPTVRYNLGLSDGFLATEPRHLAFEVHSLTHDVGPGLVIGHMELQKGGWTQNMRQTRGYLVRLGQRKVSRWSSCVVPELAQAARNRVAEYAAGLPYAEGAEYGYWINYQFRVGRWLTSHYLSHSKEHLPVYPLIEEKVTRLVSCAPLAHLVDERLLAETTWAFAPLLRDLPTLEPYRFVAQRETRERCPPAAPAQTAAAIAAPVAEEAAALAPAAPPLLSPTPAADVATPAAPPASALSGSSPPGRYIEPERLMELAEHVRTGKLREELRSLMQPSVWAVMEQPSFETMIASGVDSLRLTEFMWACYQASVLHTEGLDSW
ncbi:MAG TPA: hypothetical protein VFZ61_13260 [Polyangiales bacterium]